MGQSAKSLGSASADEVFADTLSVYRSLTDSLPLSLLVKDLDGVRLFANRAYYQSRGWSADEVIGKSDEDLFPENLATLYRRDDQKVIDSGRPLHNVEQTVDGEGRPRWIERIKSPIVDAQNRAIGLQLIFWDVTDKVVAEEQLQQERHLLRVLMEHLPESVYFKDVDSRFIRVSAQMARKFNLPNPESVIGRSDADIFTREHAAEARADELQILQSGEPIRELIEKETWPDREDTWCETTKMPLHDAKGNLIGTFGLSRDITQLRRSQEALREAVAAAEHANRAKSDFLANMSHEIRTPMNAIIGLNELLSHSPLTDEQREYVELIGDSASSLLRLLGDILDFSKIEARKLELESTEFSLRELVGRTGKTLSRRAGEKGLELACRVAPDVPDNLIGDPGRLRQILLNLIGNAIKFTEQGEVIVDVHIADSPHGHSKRALTAEAAGYPIGLIFEVRDTGIGISKEKFASVLQPFTQADTSTTRRFGGTGLGLTICRQLIALMGGDLSVRSEVGVGTTFEFDVRMHYQDGPADDLVIGEVRSLDQIAGTKVLIVDDNSTNRLILREIFGVWKFLVQSVDSGPAAIDAVRTAQNAGQPFDLIVLDLMMPDMDGFTAAEAIMDFCGAKRPTIIMLSSGARGQDATRCRQMGIDQYLTKPVIQSELLDSVMDAMPNLGPRPAKDAASKPASIELSVTPRRVLVAEDGLANQKVIGGLLKNLGHVATVVADGRAAVDAWQAALDGSRFDLILMDLHMPELDGLEATAAIRQLEAEQGLTPTVIVALTAAAMASDQTACLAAGMDGYLTKPIEPDRLRNEIARHAAASDSTDPEELEFELDEEVVVHEPTSVPSEPAPDVEAMSIDPTVAQERVGGQWPDVLQLAVVLADEAAELLSHLDQALQDRDGRRLHRAAHTLGGSAKLFDAREVVEGADRVQTLAQAEQWQELAGPIDKLRVVTERMIDELKRLI